MVGMASDPISRGMGAVVIRVYLSMCLCFITVFSWIAGANLVNLADESMRIRKKKMIPARFEDYTDYFAYLCRNQKNKTMEQTLKQPAEQAAFTREELMRRLEEHRRKKKEIIRMMEDYLKEECKKRTGREPESFEVW